MIGLYVEIPTKFCDTTEDSVQAFSRWENGAQRDLVPLLVNGWVSIKTRSDCKASLHSTKLCHRRRPCFHCFISSRCLYLGNSWVRDHSCPFFLSPLQNPTSFWFDQRVMEQKQGDLSSLELALPFNWVIVGMLFLFSRHLFPICKSKEVGINLSKVLTFYNVSWFPPFQSM